MIQTKKFDMVEQIKVIMEFTGTENARLAKGYGHLAEKPTAKYPNKPSYSNESYKKSFDYLFPRHGESSSFNAVPSISPREDYMQIVYGGIKPSRAYGVEFNPRTGQANIVKFVRDSKDPFIL